MKILIVDDHPLVRKGLSSILSLEDNIEGIQEASTIEEAMNMLSIYNQEVAIIDLRLGKEDGLDLVNKAKKKSFKTKFIVLTSSVSREDFLKAQEYGVDGYILKDAFAEDILYAFHVVSRGKKFFYPQIFSCQSSETKDIRAGGLTDREKEVLTELGNGLSNTQIAQKLFISESTVKKHVSNVLSKLGLNHRIEAALYANNLNKMCS